MKQPQPALQGSADQPPPQTCRRRRVMKPMLPLSVNERVLCIVGTFAVCFFALVAGSSLCLGRVLSEATPQAIQRLEAACLGFAMLALSVACLLWGRKLKRSRYKRRCERGSR
jgi:hypothetical protein